ncbi:MAG: ATP-binding cassette domain-containing protein [Desulfobacteraceae bacterium]|nr:ATP-binding cassette domain-containing protein [Desulfobacteraceae bacterium]
MIQVDNLIKNYKTVKALAGVDISVKPGEIFAYLGPNGAGKTTTIRILTGLTQATSGTCVINGFNIEKEVRRAKQQYGLVPQAINLDQELTVRENLVIHGWLYRMKSADISAKIDELLDYVELSEKKDSQVKTLSGGMKRRLMVARALLHGPKVLFLDEPTVGLDPGIRRKIWALIKKIRTTGTTIFLTTHYIEEAEFLADRVAFLDQGRIVALDTPDHLMENLGAWAIDRLVEDGMETVYFKTRHDAERFKTLKSEHFTLRRVNLEDAFLDLTGKKVK